MTRPHPLPSRQVEADAHQRGWDAAVDHCIELVRAAHSLDEAKRILLDVATAEPPAGHPQVGP